MRQWLFILVGSVGLAVAAGSAALAILSDGATAISIGGWVMPAATVAGATMAVAGFVGGRQSGTRRVGGPLDSDREWDDFHRRGTFAATGEMAFACPTCARTYRAASACAGRPFHCRSCQADFIVPTRTSTKRVA